ncbi:GAF domain-containing protein [Streptomyces sp. NPDC057620]|uniref:GAF domain-containing protein n=1 Tax=Streptomyces sp. NPDC057620 TaxID=3346185 RepID=UPI0036AA897C
MVQSLSASPIETSVVARPERTVVHVAGQLDHGGTMTLMKQLSDLSSLSAHSHRLVLDFSRVSFLGFAAVELVEVVAEQVRAAGGQLEVWGVDDPRLRALHLNGGLRVLRIAETTGVSSSRADVERNEVVLRQALATALRVTGAPMGNVQFLDPASDTLRISAQRGFHHPFLSFFRSVEVAGHGSACGAAAQRQRPVFVEDVRASPLFVGTAAGDVLDDAGVRSVASLPVMTPGGELVGMLSVHRAEPTVWAAEARRELSYVVQAADRLAR